MHRNGTTSRPDRILLGALAVILATASAAIGSGLSYRAETRSSREAALPRAPAPRSDTDAVLADLVAEHRCLSEALYYEARGEGRIGEQAVAEVVFHRLNAGYHGHSICAVIYEGAGRSGCQFSFTCDGALRRPREAAAWSKSEQLAAQILTGVVALRNATSGATNYHAVSVSPGWAPAMEKTIQIGNHIFYRGTGHSRES
jgi:spore germination cell wall hydrolase CwlJ-like protein